MSWSKYHRKSAELAANAEIAARRGDINKSQKLYMLAAKQEEKALTYLDNTTPRTLRITIKSAQALWLKAGR